MVIWILDSICSRHITSDEALLSQLSEKAGTIGIIWRWQQGIHQAGNVITGNIFLMDGPSHNLRLLVNFCNKGFLVYHWKGNVLDLKQGRREAHLTESEKEICS